MSTRQIMERIAYLEDLLANPQKILDVIQDDLTELAEKYGDERRTRIAARSQRRTAARKTWCRMRQC